MITINTRTGDRFVRPAMMTTAMKKHEYAVDIYGATALGYIVTDMTMDAMDAVKERMPEFLTDRRVRRHVRCLVNKDDSPGPELARLRIYIGECFVHADDLKWMADFGNALHGIVEKDLNNLRNATANFLGKFGDDIDDINAVAMVLNAQWMAAETARFCDRRASMVKGYSITRYKGGNENAATIIKRLSPWRISEDLKAMANVMVSRVRTDLDMLADRAINTGCKAFLNKCADADTWTAAINKADELNGTKHE